MLLGYLGAQRKDTYSNLDTWDCQGRLPTPNLNYKNKRSQLRRGSHSQLKGQSGQMQRGEELDGTQVRAGLSLVGTQGKLVMCYPVFRICFELI